MQKLDKIAKSFGTDKSSEIHNYCEKYEKWLPFNRLEPITVLEIGVLRGESLLTWREYFPNAKIVGIDINPDCKHIENPDKNIFIEIGSQDDPLFLQNVCNKHGKFDLILDDGSHINEHVIKSFQFLIDFVKSEGIYIVEDSVTSYWGEWGGGFRQKGTSIEFFKDLVDDVNFYGQQQETFWNVHARREDFLIEQTLKKGLQIRTDIESINFLNSIIIITKK